MAGHSKWSTIKRAKGAADAKRGQQFSKLSKAIMVAAKQGGPDPAGNARLKLAIDAARSANMPKDNINRAIDRATSSSSDNLDEVVYEGYGPGGAALLIEAITDNRNRTIAELRTLLGRHGGSIGDPGSVAWMFKTQAILEITLDSHDPDEVSLAAIEAGATEIDQGNGSLFVFTDLDNASRVSEVLANYGQVSTTVQPIPTTELELDNESGEKLTQLMEMLEDHEDINRVSTNASLEQ